VNFGYPVKDAEGKVTGIAFIGSTWRASNRVATSTPLPPEGIITVVDRNATVIARHPVTDRVRVGRKLENPRVLKHLVRHEERRVRKRPGCWTHRAAVRARRRG